MPGPLPTVQRPLQFMGTEFPDVPHTARVVRAHASGSAAAGGGGTLTDSAGGGSYLIDPARIDGYAIDNEGEYEGRILSLVVAFRTTTNPVANTDKVLFSAVRNTLSELGAVLVAYNLHDDLVTGPASANRRALLVPGGALPFAPFFPLRRNAARIGHKDQIVVGVQHVAGSTLGVIWCEAELFLALYPRPRPEND